MENDISCSVFRIKPHDFKPTVEVAACYIIVGGKLLLLKRALHKPQGNTWGVAAGKMEKGESALQAVLRETFEETGITLEESRLSELGKLYVRHPHTDFLYHMFYQEFTQLPTVKLSDEHEEYRFVSLDEAFEMPLIAGGAEALHHFLALVDSPKLKREEFYFIRHGETDANIDLALKHLDGDHPLNERGRAQALASRECFSRLPVQSITFSPYLRAKETKELLSQGKRIHSLEIADLGECQAKVWTRMVQLEEGNGYSTCDELKAFLSRALKGVCQAQEFGGIPLIVAHGGIHWSLCYHLMIENHPWKIGNCEFVHFRPVGTSDWEAEIIE